MNLLRTIHILFFDEIGQLCADFFAALEIICFRLRESETFMGGVIVMSTMYHTQLQPVSGSLFLLLSNMITCYKMVKLETCVRLFGDMPFQRLRQII